MKAAAAIWFDVAAISDVGYKRLNNEDSYGYDLQAGIFVVCDGMGGRTAGEVASSIAVEHVLGTYRELSLRAMQAEARLGSAVARANQAVWSMAQSHGELRGMGTTLVAVCVVGSTIVVGNVGDSRAYFLRNGGCVQITVDHSCARDQELDEGRPAPALQGQYITRALGVAPVAQPDFFTAELEQGDTVLLATDGLTRYVSADEVAAHIGKHNDLQEACRGLVAIAHGKGAEDNVTCLLLRAR